MPCRADALSIGVLIALARREPRILAAMRRHRNVVFTLLILWSAVSLRVMFGDFQPFGSKAFGLEYSFCALLYGLLLLSTLLSGRLAAILSIGPLRFMGSIAYGVYLFHWLINVVLQKALFYFRPTSGSTIKILVTICSSVVSIAVATASWKYFEKPLVQRGHIHAYAEKLTAIA